MKSVLNSGAIEKYARVMSFMGETDIDLCALLGGLLPIQINSIVNLFIGALLHSYIYMVEFKWFCKLFQGNSNA